MTPETMEHSGGREPTGTGGPSGDHESLWRRPAPQRWARPRASRGRAQALVCGPHVFGSREQGQGEPRAGHPYAGMEYIFGQILVATEEYAEMKAGKKRITKRKTFPSYVLVEMAMIGRDPHARLQHSRGHPLRRRQEAAPR